MKIYESVLDIIDDRLNDRRGSELLLIYITIIVAVFATIYIFITPFLNQNIKKYRFKLQQVKEKLIEDRNYLKLKTLKSDKLFYIKREKNKIKLLEDRLKDSSRVNFYIDEELKMLSTQLYGNVNWANFINSISTNANEHNILINFIKNDFNDIGYQKFGEILKIEIDVNGKFNDILKFINSIEESSLIVDIYGLTIDSKKNIHANIKISVWGIKY